MPTIHEGSLEDKNMKDAYCNCAIMWEIVDFLLHKNIITYMQCNSDGLIIIVGKLMQEDNL